MTAPPPKGRILVIDMIRGIALLAILLVHSHDHFNCYIYPESSSGFIAALNNLADLFNRYFLAGKAFMLFAFLFGVSFFIQIDRAQQRGVDFRLRFAWRLALLFLIGIIHSVFYDGDILTLFAIQGLLLIPLYKLTPRILLLTGTACVLALPFLVSYTKYLLDTPYIFSYLWENSGGERNDIFSTGSFREVAKWNFLYGQSGKWKYIIESARIGQTLGLFILGLAVGKMRVFEHYQNHNKLFKLSFISATVVWIGAQFTQMIVAQQDMSASFVDVVGNLAFVVALISIVTLIFEKPITQKVARFITPVGKVTLSAYIGQSVFFTFLLYGWGLNLSAHIGPFFSMLAGFLFFCIQALLAKAWLKYFLFGPIEWLWRSGTYMSLQPLVRRD